MVIYHHIEKHRNVSVALLKIHKKRLCKIVNDSVDTPKNDMKMLEYFGLLRDSTSLPLIQIRKTRCLEHRSLDLIRTYAHMSWYLK